MMLVTGDVGECVSVDGENAYYLGLLDGIPLLIRDDGLVWDCSDTQACKVFSCLDVRNGEGVNEVMPKRLVDGEGSREEYEIWALRTLERVQEARCPTSKTGIGGVYTDEEWEKEAIAQISADTGMSVDAARAFYLEGNQTTYYQDEQGNWRWNEEEEGESETVRA